MHPEHIEHYAANPMCRLEGRDVPRITVVVQCGGVRRWRLIAARFLMKIAGRVGGFRSVKFVKQ